MLAPGTYKYFIYVFIYFFILFLNKPLSILFDDIQIIMARIFDANSTEKNGMVVKPETTHATQDTFGISQQYSDVSAPVHICATRVSRDRPKEADWKQLNELIISGQLSGVRHWFDSRGLGSNASQFWSVNSHWPLQTAAKAGNVEILDVLLEYGFDPGEVNFFGEGLLPTAAAAGYTGMVDRLLQLGLYVSMRDDQDDTPLHVAARVTGDNSQMIKFLVARRADPNAKNNVNETPLHVAADKGSIHNVRALIESGACVNVRSPRCASPLVYAIRRRTGISEHVRVLCEMGAKSGPCQRRLCEFYTASTINSPTVAVVMAALIERNFCMSCQGSGCQDTPLYNIASFTDTSNREEVMDMIMDAGYEIQKDFQWIQNISRKETFQRQLVKYATTPRTLKQIICFAIRKTLGTSFPTKVDYLPLPDILKENLKLRNIKCSLAEHP